MVDRLLLHPAPVSPVDPAELVAEAIGITVRATVTLVLLPLRLTLASVRTVVALTRHD